jgi:hypothetical protein
MPVDPIVATDVALLLQTPPVVVLARVVVAPSHTVNIPVIEGTTGNGLTVTVVV